MKLNKCHHLALYIVIAIVLISGLFYANSVRSAESEEKIAKVVWRVNFSDPRRFSSMLTSIYQDSNHLPE